ncbi:MAG: hypothetical protein N2595_02125 [bacterium]|nr:hypothetical protein [bacterium]
MINSNLFFFFQLRQGSLVRLQSGKRTSHVNYQMDSQGQYGTTTVPVTADPAFIVHRIIYDATQNRVDMWINPPLSDTEPGLPSHQSLLTTNNLQFNAVGLFASGGLGPGNIYGFYYHAWDEIRIGRTWAQVAPIVPEPVAGALLLLLAFLRAALTSRAGQV